MKISDTTLEQLNEQADLVAIIRRHTTLKPAGKEFKGCCPFHGEKTPSFYVNPQTNLYYCFGCHAKGNAISFLVDYEKLSFMEAVKQLAQSTGIELPKENTERISYQRHIAQNNTPNPTNLPKPTKPHDSNQPASTQHPPSVEPATHSKHYEQYLDGTLYGLLNAVTAFYQDQLRQNTTAQAYLNTRRLSPTSIDEFGIGYSPSGWQHLEETFPYDIQGLLSLGLIRVSKNGRRFSLFRERIMFPIKDKQGRVVGFAGRALTEDASPKYLNSTESAVFQKQHILYGYYESRQMRATNWLIVEGYMDVIALYQAGIYGAVAPMGTAVNEHQLKNLFKFNDELTLCFDGDTAGQKAALRTLEVALPILYDGKTLKFLVLPDNHDPDTYIKAHGKTAMISAINTAVSLSVYLFEWLQRTHDLRKPEQKATAMARLKELTAKLPKGSTFRSWLNNDIYQQLRHYGKTALVAKAQPTQTQISQADQLLLCILYQPTLIMNDPLTHLYQTAGLIDIDQSMAHKLSAPPLPTWQTLFGEGVDEVIKSIHTLSPFLLHSEQAADIDANAHMILSGLNPTLQKTLGEKWRDFFYHTQHHKDSRIEILFDELLCQGLISTLKNEQQKASGLLVVSLYKKRLFALETWGKQYIKNHLIGL